MYIQHLILKHLSSLRITDAKKKKGKTQTYLISWIVSPDCLLVISHYFNEEACQPDAPTRIVSCAKGALAG